MLTRGAATIMPSERTSSVRDERPSCTRLTIGKMLATSTRASIVPIRFVEPSSNTGTPMPM
jgi:hypothetical protein